MKIRLALTPHHRLGNTGRKTGSWLEEFAAPFFVFRDAGVELTLASPKGGQPTIDPNWVTLRELRFRETDSIPARRTT
jgi:putative intracellular protease/amidase